MLGRSSRLANWVSRAGFDRPPPERLRRSINYATAAFERTATAAELGLLDGLAVYSSEDPVAVAAGNAIEEDQWLLTLMGYGDARPGGTIDDFRRLCARLPRFFGDAAAGRPTREIVRYRQADSRRRDFTAARRFPARLVSIGDAVASFNPIYAQGMSSAALQASALSIYLTELPDLDAAAVGYFRRQKIVVDAAWAVGETSAQAAAMQNLAATSLTDTAAARAFNEVAYLLRHPATLFDELRT